MSNKIVYDDYAVGAKEAAYVVMNETDNQTQTIDEVNYDPYHIESIFGNNTSNYIAFDAYGTKQTEETSVFNEGQPTSGSVVGGDNAGFVSNVISKQDRTFDTNPKLTIAFNSVNNFAGNGIAIYFGRKYCTRVKVRYKIGNTYAEAIDYTINSRYAYLDATVEGYSGVQIEFVETQEPFQYVVVNKIEFGRSITLDRIKSLSFDKTLDFHCFDVPINAMTAVVATDEELKFYDNQKLKLYKDDELIGTYWISESTKEGARIYSLTAEDAFSRLLVSTTDNVFCDNASSDMTIGSILSPYSNLIDYGSGSWYVRGYYPKGGELRKLLAYCMLEYRKHAKATPDGMVKLFTPILTDPIEIEESRIIGEAWFRLIRPITNVEITFPSYETPIYIANGGREVLNNVDVPYSPGELDVETDFPAVGVCAFDKDGYKVVPRAQDPSYYQFTVLSPFHFKMQCKYAYRDLFKNVAIQATPYKKDENTYAKGRTMTSGESRNVKSFSNLALYSTGANNWATAIATRAFSIKGEVTAKIVLNYESDGSTKYLDIGDYVQIKTKHSGIKTGTITRIDADVGVKDIVGNVVITVWE